MLKRILLIAVGALSLAFLLSAKAAVQLPMGWYVEGNVGASSISNVNYGVSTSKKNSGIAWGGNVGYKFMPFFSTEIGATKYSNVVIQNSASKNIAKSTIYSADIAGKGIWPITPGFELFAKLGVAYLRSHVQITNAAAAAGLGVPSGTHSKTGAFIGLGGDYSYHPNIPIILQWTRAIGDRSTGNLDFYSIGIGYIFP